MILEIGIMSEVGIIVCFVSITDSCPLPHYKPQGLNNALNTVGIISQLLTFASSAQSLYSLTH